MMIDNLPLSISVGFALITLVTLLLFYKASGENKVLTLILVVIAALQAALSLNGFFLDSEAMPPRTSMIAIPMLVVTILLFRSKPGMRAVQRFNFEWFAWLHTVRIPVEIILYLLSAHALIPESMTFEGRNFDIFSGLSAPLIAYFGYRKKMLGRPVLIAWNLICLLLVLHVVSTGTFAAPSPFQFLHLDQPNFAVLHFPFVWLPGMVVPVVIIGHVMFLRKSLTDILAERSEAKHVVTTK